MFSFFGSKRTKKNVVESPTIQDFLEADVLQAASVPEQVACPSDEVPSCE